MVVRGAEVAATSLSNKSITGNNTIEYARCKGCIIEGIQLATIGECIASLM